MGFLEHHPVTGVQRDMVTGRPDPPIQQVTGLQRRSLMNRNGVPWYLVVWNVVVRVMSTFPPVASQIAHCWNEEQSQPTTPAGTDPTRAGVPRPRPSPVRGWFRLGRAPSSRSRSAMPAPASCSVSPDPGRPPRLANRGRVGAARTSGRSGSTVAAGRLWAGSPDLCGGFAVRCHTLSREGTGR